MIGAANHSVRGTRATAETRCAHQDATPSLAEPRPIARASGERIFCMFWGSTALPSHRRADDPGRNGEHYARRHDRPPGNVDRPKLESVDGVPHQMADAATEMQKKGERGPEQHDPAAPGRDGCLHRGIGLRSPRSRYQPDDQDHGAGAQKYACDPIEDRENRRKLWPINLYVRRQRPRSRCCGTGHRSSLPPQSASALDHLLLDFGDRLTRIEALRTGPCAVENGVAAIKPERIFKIVEPLLLGFVAAVGQPAPSLQKHGGSKKAVAVPPMARAARGTAEAKDAFVVAVDFVSFLRRLKPFPLGLRGLRFEPRLDRRILREEMRQIGA